MHRRRVAVLYTHALFGQGIAQLLQADEQLEVTCLKVGLAETEEQLRQMQPHVIVVEGSEESPLPWSAIRDLPAALFIWVRFEDNLMDVYRGRQVVTACPETLVEAVHYGLRRRQKVVAREG